MRVTYRIEEVTSRYRLEKSFVLHCMREHWIVPSDPAEVLFDDADVARILLIHDLVTIFEVNEPGIPIILHLIDQIRATKSETPKLRAS